jgi:hypothetical protein
MQKVGAQTQTRECYGRATTYTRTSGKMRYVLFSTSCKSNAASPARRAELAGVCAACGLVCRVPDQREGRVIV